MRYLVVIPPERASDEASIHDLESEGQLEPGDQVVVAHMHFVVQEAVDVPGDEGYDGTLICTPDE